MAKRLANTTFLFFIFFLATRGQAVQKERFFQLSGIITDENNRALSNVGVISLRLKRGVLSENTGIYSITSTPGDTILFKALGFKKQMIVLPMSFEGKRYYADIVLSMDTIPIENVVVLPWKSYNEFIRDITSPNPVDPEIENMNKNIESVKSALANQADVRISPEAGYRYAMQQNFNMTATRNQYPSNNLLNPFAWAKFINGLKSGLLKNDKAEKPSRTKVKTKKKKKQ
ncbi:MAG: hypothetical protein GT598_13640 [Bacteroidales bacterium]|nr:hypothetical protein [Bacteroidales bacterium]HPM18405.1 carboxypeptidase-like regulatory domain-containing protein [Bacteroidales bacterium]HQG77338.1 carboxypeptidase-like regulatory domain-containing protein [Bacteroidales bacterium]